MTLKSDDEDSSMSQYKDMFMDTVIEQMSDTIVEKSGENITQQLYEQMKRKLQYIIIIDNKKPVSACLHVVTGFF